MSQQHCFNSCFFDVSVDYRPDSLLARTGKYEHITPFLKVLHWIPVVQRIKSKILVLTFKALNGTAPKLNDLLIPYQPHRMLGQILDT